MTWTPVTEVVTRWALRCDGTSSGGQCEALVCTDAAGHLHGDPDDMFTTLWADPVLTAENRAGLDYGGWLVLRDGRVYCPAHVAAAEYLARSALDGLPFSDTWPTSPGEADR